MNTELLLLLTRCCRVSMVGGLGTGSDFMYIRGSSEATFDTSREKPANRIGHVFLGHGSG